VSFSPLALRIPKPRETGKREMTIGLCVHVTGVGIYAGKRTEKQALDRALDIYAGKNAPFAHYVIGRDGTLYQIADDAMRAWHAGIDREQRGIYSSGAWRRKVSSDVYAAWRQSFPTFDDPLDLVRGRDPNDVYVSVELQSGPRSSDVPTDEQYVKLRDLILDVWDDFDLPKWSKWDGTPWIGFWPMMRREGRLVGHEDVEPLERTNRSGGWDPGALARGGFLRPARFDWERLFTLLEQASREPV